MFELGTDPGETSDLSADRDADAKRMLGILNGLVGDLRRRAATAGETELSSDLDRRLRELGYLGGTGESR